MFQLICLFPLGFIIIGLREVMCLYVLICEVYIKGSKLRHDRMMNPFVTLRAKNDYIFRPISDATVLDVIKNLKSERSTFPNKVSNAYQRCSRLSVNH